MYHCMDKTKVREFFDRLAPSWDENLIVYEDKMEAILDAARIGEGCRVLDVACGTGVMVNFCLRRNVASIDGIDISPAMIDICQGKYIADERVRLVCADAELYDFDKRYDCVLVFNAFPHFPDPQGLVSHLARFVEPGGTVTIAHDMGRKQLDSHHSGAASAVSHGMMHEDDVVALFDSRFAVHVRVSTPDLFIVSATKACA